ncbi:MAG: hypothetical protein RLN88_04090 [Ekhidna sp.]|uniref:hypothetical protein n=1 Tax=Ekhidna sp. TaxID=2608089 RepID=UPI0032EC1138
MKVISKTLVALAALAISVSISSAQSLDEERMERDLKIAENIIGTLLNENGRYYHNNVESNYLEDYGVIFSIPKNSVIWAYSTSGSARSVYSYGNEAVIIDTSDGDDDEIPRSDKKVDAEELERKTLEKMKEQMSAFLIDYADLIGQLKPTDRVVIQTRGRNEQIFVVGGNVTRKNEGLSAQILKSDLSAYKSGKLSREQAMGKIDWTTEGDSEVAKDIELFSTIFSRLYEPDLSNTYYLTSRRLGYTSLDNFGITFNMKFYSSSSDDGLHTIRTTGESGLTQDQRDEKVNAMYAEFEKSFKENLLDYGRTVKSLKPEEMLMFNVELTECRGCEMPEEIEVSVKGKTLKDFDSGAISREKALDQITVKKKRR